MMINFMKSFPQHINVNYLKIQNTYIIVINGGSGNYHNSFCPLYYSQVLDNVKHNSMSFDI